MDISDAYCTVASVRYNMNVIDGRTSNAFCFAYITRPVFV